MDTTTWVLLGAGSVLLLCCVYALYESGERLDACRREARIAKSYANQAAESVSRSAMIERRVETRADRLDDYLRGARETAQEVSDARDAVRLTEQRILTIEERMDKVWMQKSVNGLHADDV